jgi:hypothetical protein
VQICTVCLPPIKRAMSARTANCQHEARRAHGLGTFCKFAEGYFHRSGGGKEKQGARCCDRGVPKCKFRDNNHRRRAADSSGNGAPAWSPTPTQPRGDRTGVLIRSPGPLTLAIAAAPVGRGSRFGVEPGLRTFQLAFSRTTSVGLLASRIPRNTGCRRRSSRVHSVNLTWQTVAGLTPWQRFISAAVNPWSQGLRPTGRVEATGKFNPLGSL